MSFTHMKGDAMWGHEADLASCLACPECHDMQAAAVLQVVNAANALSQDTESPRPANCDCGCSPPGPGLHYANCPAATADDAESPEEPA